jgi:hypothetical protein
MPRKIASIILGTGLPLQALATPEKFWLSWDNKNKINHFNINSLQLLTDLRIYVFFVVEREGSSSFPESR